MVALLLAALWGYLLGSIPTGVLICRLLGRADVRWQGSGHTGGLNVSRVAGPPAGVATALIDILLGVVAATGARWLWRDPWAGTVAGAMAVVGHNWSALIGFRGGIGLSTLVGATVSSFGALGLSLVAIVVLIWVLLVRLLRVHRARSTIAAVLTATPLAWALSFPWPGVALAGLGGLAVILKTLPDWNRRYT